MRKHLLSFFIPHKKNNYHAYSLRIPFLVLIAALVIGLNFIPIIQEKVDVLRDKNILGIATNITKDEIIKLTNQERAKNNLPPLKENSLLDQVAELKAKNMVEKNYWAHFAPDGTSPWYFFNKAGYDYSYAGENLAKNFDTSQQVVQAWMNSPSHRENVLGSNYSEIGIALINGSLQNEETTLVVQVFGQPLDIAIMPPESNEIAGVNEVKVAQNVTNDPISILSQNLTAPLYKQFSLLALIFIFNMFLLDRIILGGTGVSRKSTGHTAYHMIAIATLIFILAFLSKGVIL